MTDAQLRALNWLAERNGEGVLDRYGRVVAGGEDSRSIAAETWLRLIAGEFVVGRNGHLYLMDKGRQTIEATRK